MSEGITFYAFKKEALPTAPPAVRKFIEDFYEEKDVFGISCLVAVSTDYKSPWNAMEDADYEEGLSEDELASCGVFTWLSNHPEAVFEYSWS